MEKEPNKIILKFSRIFTNSCRTQNLSQVIDHRKQPQKPPSMADDDEKPPQKPPFMADDHHKQPQKHPLMADDDDDEEQQQHPPLMCKPRCPDSIELMVRENCIIAAASHRRKITGKYNLLSPADRCPPASPASPLFLTAMKQKNKNSNPNKKHNHKHKPHLPANHPFNFSSSNETDFFSSDDEREETFTNFKNFKNSIDKSFKNSIDETEQHHQPLFSSLKSVSFSSKSISLSSDSDPPAPSRVRSRARRRRRRNRRRRAAETAEIQGKVRDTFAVVKSSRDPYGDFRTSMVEMIMEKQIFGSKELEELLGCFLSLNSPHHHRVIMEVFAEICNALFSHFE